MRKTAFRNFIVTERQRKRNHKDELLSRNKTF